MRALLLVTCLATLLAVGCGPDAPDEATGTMTAALEVPRALVDELASVEIFVYRQKDGEPAPADLLVEDPPYYEAYEDYRATKTVTIAFQTTDTADIKGIPDRGPVWVFYARGTDAAGWLIGHGAAGPVWIYSDRDFTEVTIRMDPVNQ